MPHKYFYTVTFTFSHLADALIQSDLKTDRDQMAERLGSRAINQKVVGSIPGRENDVVSLDKALHPTFLGENVPVLTVSCSG